MWLLDTERATLHHFDRPRECRYVILSHVWRLEGEQSFQELKVIAKRAAKKGPALKKRVLGALSQKLTPSVWAEVSDKISGCCALARRHGFQWVWIDSCCIDKTSSTELSEAINSMHEWYAAAEVCFAFLEDVRGDHDPRLRDSDLRRSRWFTRGWTLQELIAPRAVVFVSKEWRLLGTRESMADVVEEVTGIERAVLTRQKGVGAVSVARRMAWAARRHTTREEDRAYSLMGLFGVNMPTIYGEGANAFVRLQEEILKHVPDQSIFAWGPILHDDSVLFKDVGPRLAIDSNTRYWQSRNLFASSPEAFLNSAGVSSVPLEDFETRIGVPLALPEYTITSYGMRARFPLIPIRHDDDKMTYLAILACEDCAGRLLALLLYPQRKESGRFYVGHYIGRPHVPPNAYFRAVWLSDSQGTELLRSVEKPTDVCVPYRPSLMVDRTPDPSAPASFKCPCDVVVPEWVLGGLQEKGFNAAIVSAHEDEHIFHVSETRTSTVSCALVLRSAWETIRIELARCLCLGGFLCVSAMSSGSSGLGSASLPAPDSASSGGALNKPDGGSSNGAGEAHRGLLLTRVREEGRYTAARCLDGHVATWKGGSKEFILGLRRVRLTVGAWLTRQDVYSLAVEIDRADSESEEKQR